MRSAAMADFTPHPIKPAIDLSVLEQLDVRVGTILSVRHVSASTRLVQLTVDFGDHQRSIVAALKQERSDPSEIEGRQALFVLNLPPRDMMGVRSEGMLFDIGYADGVRPGLAVRERPGPTGVRGGWDPADRRVPMRSSVSLFAAALIPLAAVVAGQ